ncbi:conjugal transfer protein TraD [Sphingobacterium siyangense]|uniref:Conjugal transfer protein TraD n=1 Tax=Sphingobacterium siyangense TaxID=459529 RepID=A0A562ML91_9SPHI|nr:conjugal transfer protein TraD [Sphingobacterium siyangense]TWI20331.1 hypothetical protein IQ31_02286 [Sphingobacterium siyangense]
MEVVIVICLILVIILLAKDKIIINKVEKKQDKSPVKPLKLPEIMGVPKPNIRLSQPNVASEGQKAKASSEVNNFETEVNERDFAIEIPQEELDDVFGISPDLDEEENEWMGYGEPNGEDGLARGVTFEELNTVGSLLQEEVLEPALQIQAVDIVQRIQGTELYSLLEDSIENASQKIARLLDRSINSETDSGSSTMRDNNLDDFDIGEFV